MTLHGHSPRYRKQEGVHPAFHLHFGQPLGYIFNAFGGLLPLAPFLALDTFITAVDDFTDLELLAVDGFTNLDSLAAAGRFKADPPAAGRFRIGACFPSIFSRRFCMT